MKKQPVTIIDVARKAGVSPSTVSQALNGKRPVSSKTKALIYNAIDELGYVPSYTASHLKKGKSSLLGCYVADITQDFTAFMLKGIEKAIKGTGYSLIFASGTDIDTDCASIIKYFRKYRVDGLLSINHLSSTFMPTPNESVYIPMVLVNWENPDYNSVIPANYQAGSMVARHLYEKGVRKPLFLGGPKERLSVIKRLAGFKTEFLSLGIEIPEANILFDDFTYQAGYDMVLKALESKLEFDGVFCANDYIAIGAIKRFQENSYRIPQDIKIVGFDNRDIAKYCSIPLTTVEQNLESVGEIALRRLVKMIQSGDKTIRNFQSEPQLIIREST